ncbi:MAG: ABC transporter permease subunit, partial [Chelatococcus sp.]|uniref:ABC transporter permease subunit n=1 Tax=Chelatococcus sp. TaxID=1953771 RepID=UPI0025BFFE07
FMSLAINARLLRASMLEVAGQRHVYYARLRGLSDGKVERGHVLRNAILPIITATGMHAGELIGGTLVIESVFGWPGLGRYAVSAIFNRDYPVIQCFTLMMVLIFVLCNLLADIFYAWADPRIRLNAGSAE